MFTIYGGATEFNQWELDKFVVNDCMKEGDEVVFRNSHGETYVVKAFAQNGEILADVPNYLLQTASNILVDLGQGNERHTECRTTFAVTAQDKPDGYDCKHNLPARPEKSGGGVSSWNDLTDKPFGEEGSLADLEVLLPLAEHRIEYLGSGYGTFKYEQIDLTVGETYTVLFDGVEYVCAAQEIPNLTDYVYLGGEDSSSNNGIPFSFVRQRDGWSCSVTLSYNNPNVDPETATFTLAVYKGAVRIKTIDPKYLPGSHIVIPVTINNDGTMTVNAGSATVQKACDSYKNGGSVSISYNADGDCTVTSNAISLMDYGGGELLALSFTVMADGRPAGVAVVGIEYGEVFAEVQLNT